MKNFLKHCFFVFAIMTVFNASLRSVFLHEFNHVNLMVDAFMFKFLNMLSAVFISLT